MLLQPANCNLHLLTYFTTFNKSVNFIILYKEPLIIIPVLFGLQFSTVQIGTVLHCPQNEAFFFCLEETETENTFSRQRRSPEILLLLSAEK